MRKLIPAAAALVVLVVAVAVVSATKHHSAAAAHARAIVSLISMTGRRAGRPSWAGRSRQLRLFGCPNAGVNVG